MINALASITPPNLNCASPGLKAYSALCNILGALGAIILILKLAAVIYFIYGIGKYVGAGGDTAKAKAGRSAMLYGVIGLAVIFGVDVIIAYLLPFFGITDAINIPFI